MEVDDHKWNSKKSKNYTAPQLRERAVHLMLNENKSPKEVHNLLGLSVPSIMEYVDRARRNGHVYTDEELKKKRLKNKYKRSRKRETITPICGAIIKTLFEINKQLTIERCKEILWT